MSSRNYRLEENPLELPFNFDEIPRLSPWVVVHTKSRCEKLLAQFCLDHELPYFLPYLETSSTGPSGQITRSLIPLFPGIIFLTAPVTNPTIEGLEYSKDQALRSTKVFSFLHTRSSAGQQTLRSELALIATESAKHRTFETFEWHHPDPNNHASMIKFIGRTVEIVSPHCCQGLRGHIVQIGNKERFVIQLSFLGRPTSMEVSSKFLKPIP